MTSGKLILPQNFVNNNYGYNDAVFGGSFPAGQPMQSAEPNRTIPRHSLPRVGQNVILPPRHEVPGVSGFEILNFLAESTDLIQTAEHIVINQIVGRKWDIIPIDSSDKTSKKDDIKAVRKFFKYPDGEKSYSTWLREALKIVTRYDALSLYKMRDNNGKLIGLRSLDGSKIKPLSDSNGYRPQPPLPAYQQIIYGRPEWVATSNELIYAPMNPRFDSLYGTSPVERILTATMMYLNKQNYDSEYYTKGSTPDGGIYAVEPNDQFQWDANMVKQCEDEWLITMSDPVRRQGMRFLPTGKFINTKEYNWTNVQEQWFGKKVCLSYGIHQSTFSDRVSKAGAASEDRNQTEIGLQPYITFIEEIFTRVIQEDLGYENLMFKTIDEKLEDEAAKVTKNVQYLALGIYNRNEIRQEEGKEPIAGGDAYTVTTGNSIIPVEQTAKGVSPQTGQTTTTESVGVKGVDQITSEGKNSETAKPAGAKVAPGAASISQKLGKSGAGSGNWDHEGRPGEVGGSGGGGRIIYIGDVEVIKNPNSVEVNAKDKEAKLGSGRPVEDNETYVKAVRDADNNIYIFDGSLATHSDIIHGLYNGHNIITKPYRQDSNGVSYTSKDFITKAINDYKNFLIKRFKKNKSLYGYEDNTITPLIKTCENQLGLVNSLADIHDLFKDDKKKVLLATKKLQQAIKSSFGTIQTKFVDDYERHHPNVDEIDKMSFVLPKADEIAGLIVTINKIGGDKAFKQIEDKIPPDNIINVHTGRQQAEEEALNYAGDLIKDIDDSTRGFIKETVQMAISKDQSWEDIKDKLSNNDFYAFSDSRAGTIARTEEARALNVGALGVWDSSGIVNEVNVSDGDGCSECSEIDGAVWSIEEAMANPLSHPNCVRSFSAIVSTLDENGAIADDVEFEDVDKVAKGGAGSGNWDHEGRPGEVGGSGGGGTATLDNPIGSGANFQQMIDNPEKNSIEVERAFDDLIRTPDKITSDEQGKALLAYEAKMFARFPAISNSVKEFITSNPSKEDTISFINSNLK